MKKRTRSRYNRGVSLVTLYMYEIGSMIVVSGVAIRVYVAYVQPYPASTPELYTAASILAMLGRVEVSAELLSWHGRSMSLFYPVPAFKGVLSFSKTPYRCPCFFKCVLSFSKTPLFFRKYLSRERIFVEIKLSTISPDYLFPKFLIFFSLFLFDNMGPCGNENYYPNPK